jgi:ABC-type glycerol-3-phosphate transport system permease component
MKYFDLFCKWFARAYFLFMFISLLMVPITVNTAQMLHELPWISTVLALICALIATVIEGTEGERTI